MKEYVRSRLKGGEGAGMKALGVIRDALIANGFAVREYSARSLRATGPGMNSSRENPLRGFSMVEVAVAGGEISFSGEMKGIRALKFMVLVFPFLLCGVLALAFSGMGKGSAWVAMAPAAPWLVLGPLMTRYFVRSSIRAAEALVTSAVTVSG